MRALKLKRGRWYLLERPRSVDTWEKHPIQILRRGKNDFYKARVLDTGEEIHLRLQHKGASAPSTSQWRAEVAVEGQPNVFRHYSHCTPMTDEDIELYVRLMRLQIEPSSAEAFLGRVLSWLRIRKFW